MNIDELTAISTSPNATEPITRRCHRYRTVWVRGHSHENRVKWDEDEIVACVCGRGCKHAQRLHWVFRLSHKKQYFFYSPFFLTLFKYKVKMPF